MRKKKKQIKKINNIYEVQSSEKIEFGQYR